MRPRTPGLSFALLLLTVLSIGVERVAFADEEADKAERESLMPAIQTELGNLASALSGVADASSDDGIESAMGYARSLGQKVDRLDDIKGSDSAAGDIADDYPDYIEDFNEAASALMKLKSAQLVITQRNLGNACTEETKTLAEAVKPFLSPPDPAGLEKIPQLAEASKGKIHDDYASQLAQESDLTSAYGVAKNFSASGDWSNVTSRMREGADGTWTKYAAALKATKENCVELDKGKDQAFIVASLGTLTGAGADSRKVLDDILRDWTAWKELRRELASKYVLSADKIRFAMCDDDEEQILSRVEAAENSVQGSLKGPYESLDKELDVLIERIDKLEEDKALAADARKWRGVMRGAKTRLKAILDGGGLLQGTQNAKVRARIQIGVDKHAQLQTGCTEKEYKIPDGRIDCLNISDGHCEVIEIKPNNEKARSKGRRQLAGYQLTITRMHDDGKLTTLLERCVTDGRLNIVYEVETYEFCPVPDDDIDAMLAEQVKQAASTADE